MREDGEIEVVVIVGDENLSVGVDADSDGVVGNPFPADLTQELTFVVENLKKKIKREKTAR